MRFLIFRHGIMLTIDFKLVTLCIIIPITRQVSNQRSSSVSSLVTFGLLSSGEHQCFSNTSCKKNILRPSVLLEVSYNCSQKDKMWTYRKDLFSSAMYCIIKCSTPTPILCLQYSHKTLMNLDLAGNDGRSPGHTNVQRYLISNYCATLVNTLCGRMRLEPWMYWVVISEADGHNVRVGRPVNVERESGNSTGWMPLDL